MYLLFHKRVRDTMFHWFAHGHTLNTVAHLKLLVLVMFYSILQLVVVASMQPRRATNVAQQNSITFLKTLWGLYVVCFVCNAIVQFSKVSFVPQCQQCLKVSCHVQRSRLNYVVIQRNRLSLAWGCSRTRPLGAQEFGNAILCLFGKVFLDVINFEPVE